MRILLFGKNGQVGWELQRTLQPLGKLIALDIDELDLSLTDQIRETIQRVAPDVIINASAFTAVDRAEEQEELAHAVNAIAPGIMAQEAKLLDAVLLHYSTDFVFDGTKREPYTEGDATAPLNAYGRTKLEGEQAIQNAGCAHVILRTSWVYSFRAESFPVKVLRWAREHEILSIVDDQIGSPTWSRMLAECTAQMIASSNRELFDWFLERCGIYHLAGKGAVSRYEWAKRILELNPQSELNIMRSLEPASSAEFSSAANRPCYTALDVTRFEQIFRLKMPTWDHCLQLAMESLHRVKSGDKNLKLD